MYNFFLNFEHRKSCNMCFYQIDFFHLVFSKFFHTIACLKSMAWRSPYISVLLHCRHAHSSSTRQLMDALIYLLSAVGLAVLHERLQKVFVHIVFLSLGYIAGCKVVGLRHVSMFTLEELPNFSLFFYITFSSAVLKEPTFSPSPQCLSLCVGYSHPCHRSL